METNIDNNSIVITQNRLYTAGIMVIDNNDYRILSPTEKLIFGIKKTQCDTTYIIKKELTSEDVAEDGHTYILTLTTLETDLDTGLYFYDVALQIDDELITVVPCTDCEIKSSIVRSECQ